MNHEMNMADLLIDGCDFDHDLAAIIEGEHRPLAGEQPMRPAEAVPVVIGDRPHAAAHRRQVSVLFHGMPSLSSRQRIAIVDFRQPPVSRERAEAIRQGVG
jgi:hypothetical protein